MNRLLMSASATPQPPREVYRAFTPTSLPLNSRLLDHTVLIIVDSPNGFQVVDLQRLSGDAIDRRILHSKELTMRQRDTAILVGWTRNTDEEIDKLGKDWSLGFVFRCSFLLL